MIFCDFSGFSESIFRANCAISPDLQHQLIIVRALTYTGRFDRIFYLSYRRKNSIHRNCADNIDIFFVDFAWHIATAQVYLEFEP